MRIGVVGTRGFPNVQGGVESHCEHLYEHLAQRGCDVTVFARRPYVGTKAYKHKGVKIVPLACPKSKHFEAFLHTFFGVLAAKKMGCDMLHIHAVGPSIFAPLARLVGLKVVKTNHGPDYKRAKWGLFAKVVIRLGEYLGSRWSNAMICISHNIADDMVKKYGRESTVIPNGVIIPHISKNDESLKRYRLEKGKYILSVGRFVPEKGFHDLIEAYNILKPDYKLVIVGDADHPNTYSLDLKDNAKKNPNIVLTGFLSGKALRELYSHTGLFVLPSYYEGLPIVLLEAISYKLSCIASDIRANKIVKILPEDRFFKVGDVNALAEKMGEFIRTPITDEAKTKQLNEINENYIWKGIADRTFKVYNEVVGGRVLG